MRSLCYAAIIISAWMGTCASAVSLAAHGGTTLGNAPAARAPHRLPPIVEPLLPAEIPLAWRTLAQQQQLAEFSPVETTWHLQVLTASVDSTHDEVAWPTIMRERSYPARTGWYRKSSLTAGPRHWSSLAIYGARPIVGDFNRDGTIDLGFVRDGEWFIDLDHNGVWNSGDLHLRLGSTADQAICGDWNGDGRTDIGRLGFAQPDDLAALDTEPGLPDSENQTLLTRYPLEMHSTSHAPRHVLHFGGADDLAVAGDFNGDGIETVGVYRRGRWMLDVNGNGQFDTADACFTFGDEHDLPVVGDLDGDGRAECGIFRAGLWRFDLDHNGRLDERDVSFTFGQAGDLPLVTPARAGRRAEFFVYRP